MIVRKGMPLLLSASLLVAGCRQYAADREAPRVIDVSENPGTVTSTVLRDRVAKAVYSRNDSWDKWLVISAISPEGEDVFYYSKDTGGTLPKPYHAFRMGSISKTFTGTLYAEQGDRHTGPMRLRDCRDPDYAADSLLSIKIAQVCPQCAALPSSRAGVRIEQLATHNSGLAHRSRTHLCTRTDYFMSVTKSPSTPTYFSTCIQGDSQSQDVPVGTYEYSNWGIGLLGHLLAADYDAELRGDQDFNDLAHARLLTPLGMGHTFGPSEEPPFGTLKAPLYSCDSLETCQPAPAKAPTGPGPYVSGPAANFWSTGPDMLNFLRYSMDLAPRTAANGRLVDARDQIFCERGAGSENKAPDTGLGTMGLGWSYNTFGGDPRWNKGGDGGNYGAYMTFSPAKQVGIVVLTNTNMENGPKEIAHAFVDLY